MLTVNPRELRMARRARDIAAIYYLFNPRVTLIDVGWKIRESLGRQVTEELAVRVHLQYKPRGAELEAFTQRYQNLLIDKKRIPFPVDLVEATYPFQWYGYGMPPSPRAQIFRPLRGGISISNEWFYTYGTLGGIVKDQDQNDMILSNWHVLAGSAYVRRGTRIYQPGSADGGRSQHVIARLERHAMNQGIDAAVARITDDGSWVNDQLDVGPVLGVTAPTLGMRVIKSGRGSDVTNGVVDGIEGEYPIRYGGFPRKIKHVYRIVPVSELGEVSRGGDSGSWWLEEDTKKAVALHFAGFDSPETALAMAMPPVLKALNVDIAIESEPVREYMIRRREPVWA